MRIDVYSKPKSSTLRMNSSSDGYFFISSIEE